MQRKNLALTPWYTLVNAMTNGNLGQDSPILTSLYVNKDHV